MKRLRLLIIIFCLALSVPMGYLVWRTYSGLKQEEIAKLNFFSDALFDEIERELSTLVEREEGRAVDEYGYWISPPEAPLTDLRRSPLSQLPPEPYITGYLQNNPDGSFQTPVMENNRIQAGDRQVIADQLKDFNQKFNRKRLAGDLRPATVRFKAKEAEKEDQAEAGLADRYLKRSPAGKGRTALGQQEKRVDSITARQAFNVAKQESVDKKSPKIGRKPAAPSAQPGFSAESLSPAPLAESYRFENEMTSGDTSRRDDHKVEVAPLQSVFIDDDHFFVFRRIVINDQIYRQGFILQTSTFLHSLADGHFSGQPMAGYARLRMTVYDGDRVVRSLDMGTEALQPVYERNRFFPDPFGFLSASLSSDQIPQAPGRGILNLMIAFFSLAMLLGLFSIYRNARGAFELSERRAKFVSSVTHELKTPLANIRMYVEMLEQGIARDSEREQEYFRILDTENARLSRLITNVLELSKLEKKKRRLNLKPGDLAETLNEVHQLMAERVKKEGFRLTCQTADIPPFPYDEEVMIQVLINLIENSLKFGRHAEVKEIDISARRSKNEVTIRVTDTGPGIRPQDLKKVFDDFYRVEAPLIRHTAGTGIGLALVKKYVTAMGGTVRAENNRGPGCRFTITLPRF